MNKTIIGSVEQVYSISDSLLSDCYCMANMTRPDQAAAIYACLRNDVESRRHPMFVFYDSRGVCGFIKGKFIQPNQSHIDWLFVDSMFRGRGIGQKLMTVYTNFCRENNVSELTLYSAPNLRALNFYAKCGFERVGGNYKMRKDLTR